MRIKLENYFINSYYRYGELVQLIIAIYEEINNNKINFTDALFKLTEKEIEFKNERASKIQIAVYAFPFEKTLNDFEFDFQPSLNKAKIKDLETLRFLDNKENVLFYGNSGVGKLIFILYSKIFLHEKPLHPKILNGGVQ